MNLIGDSQLLLRISLRPGVVQVRPSLELAEARIVPPQNWLSRLAGR